VALEAWLLNTWQPALRQYPELRTDWAELVQHIELYQFRRVPSLFVNMQQQIEDARQQRVDAEARAKREAEEKARREAEAYAKNEAEQRAKREVEEKARGKLEKKLEPYWSGFQKIGRNGEILPLTAPQWAAVKHIATGLIWATNWAKDDDFPVTDGLQWYQLGEGFFNDGKNTESHIQQVNSQRWCGQQDWYLPSKEELESLANALQLNGNYSLERYKAIFPNDEAYHFWSASTVAGPLSNAWLVNFDDGYTSDFIKDVSGHVRAVRVGQ
jgi:hypothetical protein